MKLFKRITAFFQLRNAIDQAERAHAKDGDVYYVIPGFNGKLLITDRKYFKLLKRKHLIAKSRTMQDVRLGCFYRTAGVNVAPLTKEESTFRRSKFFTWRLA